MHIDNLQSGIIFVLLGQFKVGNYYPAVRTGLVIPVFYPAIRTGSSNTRVFFGGHLPQTSSFRLAKQIIIVSSTTQVRARILSDRNMFCTLGEGQ